MRSERVAATAPRKAGGDYKSVAEEMPSRWRAWMGRARAWAETAAGRVWLDAAWIWLVTRAIFVALTVLVPVLLTRGGSGPSPLSRWGTQDGTLFAQIALHGYATPVAPMMWPLLPALEHLLMPLTGGDPALAGMLVANAAFFGMLVLLRRLAAREVGPEAARRATWYLAIFPTAFYFFAPYSESLFLLLSIGAFGAMRARRWWLAGALGCLAMLARSAGALLVVPFAVEFLLAWRAHAARWWQAFWVLLIPAAAGIFSGYLALEHADPLGWLHAAKLLGHTLHWPWDAFLAGTAALASASGVHAISVAHLVLNLLAATIFVVLTVAALRMLPLSYGLYAAAIVVYFLSLSEGAAISLAAGDGRYVLMVFPAFMVLGVWGCRRQRLHELLMVAMPALMAILAAHFLLLLAGG